MVGPCGAGAAASLVVGMRPGVPPVTRPLRLLDTLTLGPARRRRRMTRALEELDRLDAARAPGAPTAAVLVTGC